jgi:hypothetical protein
MKRYHIKVVELEDIDETSEDELGIEFGRFNLVSETESKGAIMGTGMTLDDALTDFAKRNGIPLWNEEQYAKEHK